MKRIKRVDVMMERNGKAHKMASFKTIKGAQAYMNDFANRVYNYCRQFTDNKTPCEHFAKITYRRGHGGFGIDFILNEDFWFNGKQSVIGQVRIIVVR